MPFATVEDLVTYQKLTESNVKRIAKAKLQTEYGEFDISIYKEAYTNKEHVFLSMGDFTNGLVRLHSECLTGDVFFSRRCDCNSQLRATLKKISQEGRGAIVYLRQEGRDIGLGDKIKAYALQQNEHLDTVDANLELGHKDDERNYHQAAWILKEEGFKTVRLYTNNPDKIKYLQMHGLEVKVEKLPASVNEFNIDYLKTKKTRMGHDFFDL
jgi:3,4-dihydroxy 2-butanone 4-phosphate synthase/GTP cyclohydrolase II